MSADPDTDADRGADPEAETEIDTDTDSDVDIGTADTMRERSNESRIKLWVVLGANRLLITGLMALVFFIGFVGIGQLFIPAFESTLRSDDMIDLLFSTMIGAIITAATLVVTISQLVISQENGPLGEQRERMSNTMDFRDFTEELIGAPTPPNPSAFLSEIITASERHASALRDTIAGNPNAQLRAEVDEFTDSLNGNAEEIRDRLDGASFGSFGVLNAALNYNYGIKIFHVERIANEYPEDLTDEDMEILDDLKASLSMFGPAREHIKTLYFEWALINLSQLILYVSVPALLVAGSAMVFIGGSSFPNSTFGISHTILVLGAAFTITLFPFFLLVSYVLRVATIAKRTLAIGPLILRGSER
jgi:ABC-type antimicrobial peptide transport system permease subunit